MPPAPPERSAPAPRRKPGPAEGADRARRGRPPASPADPAGRRRFQLLLVFVTVVLVMNALVGERGLMETIRARRQHGELVTAIAQLRAENARLSEQARRLVSDPATIEALARQELGLIRPGELLFIIRDAHPAPAFGR